MSIGNHREHHRMILVVLMVAAHFGASCLAFISHSYSPMPSCASALFSSTIFGTADTSDNFEIEIDEDDDMFENVAAAVLVPGFLTGADEFEPLCAALTAKGIPTVAVPMPNWHWLPSLGGRSVRPILERIDFTVKHLVANLENTDNAILSNKYFAVSNIPKYKYSVGDCYEDFHNNIGTVDECPLDEPKGIFFEPENLRTDSNKPKKKIALIGHSAGGWISRIYLSSSDYGCKSYRGSAYIHSLVTLGSPHSDAPGPAFDSIKWINNPSHETERLSGKVRSLGVAGRGFQGADWGMLTSGSYGFCVKGVPDAASGEHHDGDGVTPLFSALGMPGSESMVVDGVTHFCWSDVFGGGLVAPELTADHRNGRHWYGSDSVLDQWAGFIHDESKLTKKKQILKP